MAKEKSAKVTFLADTKDFRKNVTEANSTLTEIRSELKLNEEQMKTNGASTDALAERHKLLEAQLEQAKSKTQNLAAQMESCTENFGENSSEAQKLATQINNAKIAEEKIRQEINKVNKELADQSEESDDTRNALEKLEDTISDQEKALSDLKSEYSAAALEYGTNSREAKSLAREIKDLSSELNDNRSKMSRVEKAADNMAGDVRDAGDAAEDANEGFTVWKATLADLASSGIQSILSGVSGLASSFWNLGDETRELRTNLGKVEVAFTNSGLTAEQAAETYEDFYAIVADEGQATEAVAHIAKMADSQEDLADWTTIATGVYATFGDSLPIESLTEAANETIKVGTVTGSLADALNWSTMSSEEWQTAFEGHPKALKKFERAIKQGLPVEDAFNEALTKCTTESEREQVIRQALTGLYGEASAAYAETNGAIMDANEAQANYNGALASLGEIIEPLKTTFMNGMAGMLESVAAFISGFDIEGLKTMISDAFAFINDTVFPAIQTGIQWFIDNKDLVIAGLTAIVAGIAAFQIVSIVQTAVGAFKAFQAATEGLTLAQKLLNLVMEANPIGIIIALVAALVAAFIYLWNNCEWFREFWIGLWDSIKAVAGVVVDALVEFFTVTIPEAWNAFVPWVTELWNNIWSTISTFASNIWTSVTTWFTNTKDDVVSSVSDLWASVTEWFSSLWTDTSTAAQNIWQSVTQWFSNTKTSVVNYAMMLWQSVTSYFSQLKTNLIEAASNIWSSVTQWFNNLRTSAVNIWNNLKTSVVNVFTNAKNTVVQTASDLFSSVGRWFSNLRTSAVNIWNGLKTSISNAFTNARDSVVSTASDIWKNIIATFGRVKNKVTEIWNNIKSAIEKPINNAKDTISDVVEKIKSALDFEWSIPKPKLPHFSVSGGKAPWGFMGEGSLPSVSVDWYAKGAILEAPTLFGVGANGNLMGGGEAGAEAVAPIDVLLGYVRTAVADVFQMMSNASDMDSALSHIESLENHLETTDGGDLSRLIDAIEDLANRPINIGVDGVQFATATAGASDTVSGSRLNLKSRGLALP